MNILKLLNLSDTFDKYAKVKEQAHAPISVWRNPVHFCAFGFGSGAVPVASGTFGTLMAIPFYLLMQSWNMWMYVLMLIVTFAIGVYFCEKTAKDLNVHDHPGIVWDEFVGYWITMFLAPTGMYWVIYGFLLFRVFDVVKPWPIRYFDRKLISGFGIMIDDVLAAVYAWAILQLTVIIFIK